MEYAYYQKQSMGHNIKVEKWKCFVCVCVWYETTRVVRCTLHHCKGWKKVLADVLSRLKQKGPIRFIC